MSFLGDLFGASAKNKQQKTLATGLNNVMKNEQARFAPYAAQGVQSNNMIGSLLGLNGSTAGAEGLDQFRNATGYQDTMNAAMNGVTSNAAARGLLGSSGTGKVFQNNAAQLAQGSFGSFLQNLMGQQGVGMDAAGNQANIGVRVGVPQAEAYAGTKGMTAGLGQSLLSNITKAFTAGAGG